jgi:hypothetical protein
VAFRLFLSSLQLNQLRRFILYSLILNSYGLNPLFRATSAAHFLLLSDITSQVFIVKAFSGHGKSSDQLCAGLIGL